MSLDRATDQSQVGEVFAENVRLKERNQILERQIKSNQYEIFDGTAPSKSALRRRLQVCIQYKNYIIGITVVILVVGTFYFSSFYQMKLNHDLIQGFTKNEVLAQTADANVQATCQGPQLRLSFPDIDYAFLGYNILRGYPFAIGHDPGFTYPIFAAEYEPGRQTADCRYSVPKGLLVIPDISCDTSFSSQTIQTKYEFSRSLSVSASASGKSWGVKFSASSNYKESSREVSTGESVKIVSSANCNYYFSKLIQGQPPNFDNVFLSWVNRLEKTDLEETYFEFFDTYGTHFATKITFGARYTFEYKMATRAYEAQRTQGVNVAASASYSSFFFSAHGSLSTDYSSDNKVSSFMSSAEKKTIAVGAPPPADGDALTWASTVQNNPVPTLYELASIETLFAEEYFKNTNVNFAKIRTNIEKYQITYCQSLKVKGEVESCETLTPGVILKGTKLSNQYDKLGLSYSDCIDHCLKQVQCVAVSYCKTCQSGADAYVCNVFNTNKTIAADAIDGWESVVFSDKLTTKLQLNNSAIIGTPRDSAQDQSKIKNVTDCENLCKTDAYCLAFSYCNCSEKTAQCEMYREINLFGIKAEGRTNSFFISKRSTASPNATSAING